jgi:putative ABC transport system permease protein
VRQMLTESMVLSVFGGVAGLLIAAWCHRSLLALVGDRIPIPRLEQISLDATVVGFTMATAIVTGLAFGIVPAFVSTSQSSDALRDSGRHGGGHRLHRLLNGLVVAEVALSLVLLAGAGLLMRSFLKLQSVDPGFRADGVLTAIVALPTAQYNDLRGVNFFRDSLSRIATLPGVEHAAGSSCQPVPLTCIGTSFWRADRPRPAVGQTPSAQVRPVTPKFFKTLAIPQIAGRDFSDSDSAESTPVAIVSEAVARLHFGDGSPLGRRLRINVDHANGRDDVEWTIVGVVGNIRSNLDGPLQETIFIPRTQRPSLAMVYFVRTDQDPVSIAPAVRTVIHSLEPATPIRIQTLADVIGASIGRPRVISVLVGVFAIVALALAAVGVYGVMAYSVRERTQEIGVRMALGASAASVFRLVIGQALRLVIIGVGAGLIAAGVLTRLLVRLLFGVEPLDPWTFAATTAILLGVAAIASYVPARRGMRMAPVDALRTN